MTPVIDRLVQADQALFLWLNSLHTPWLDNVMYWVTFKYTWIPMYLLLIFISLKPNPKKGLGILLTVLLAVGLADQITSGLMKPYFARLRPCHNADIQDLVHLVTGCGGTYGFASSHASTSFALAMAWFSLLRSRNTQIGWLFIWAALYSYSRVYVGVHYPADIIVGILIGLTAGWCCVRIYYTFLTKFNLR
jgi:undecaprenyl-diphosphatase